MEGSEEDHREKSRKWLEGMSKGLGHELEGLTLQGLRIEAVHRGLIRCNFLIPKHLSDKDGNWHVGAIALLIDDVGAAAIFSAAGLIKVSVGFSISYLSPAKIQEEVEIEAEVVGNKDRLSLVLVRIKKKQSGEMIVFAKQWMSSAAVAINHQPSKL